PSRISQLVAFFFFVTDTATTDIYTLSLHDALPISLKFNESANTDNARHVIHRGQSWRWKTFEIDSVVNPVNFASGIRTALAKKLDRKSTRLNSSHLGISYAVFCLKKKKKTKKKTPQ